MSSRSSAVTRAVLYGFFALVATLANIGAQALIVWVHPATLAVPLSILVGTATGLVIKYLLDKRFIFHFKARNGIEDARVFSLYTLAGLGTTVLFWAVEWSFHWIWGTPSMRYMGAAIGLGIGYLAKYQIDKRWVFRSS